MTWILCFAFCLVWVILTAPVFGVVAASLSGGAIGFTVTMLWELGRFIRDVIHIWRHPYDDRRAPHSSALF